MNPFRDPMKPLTISFAALTFLFALFLFFPSGCARNPVTRHYEVTLMSSKEEARLGEEQDKAVTKLYGKYENKGLQEYLQSIGSKLVSVAHKRPFTYHFNVIDSGEINAFALPGGYIYVTRGILAQCNSEAELAGVVGHEIAHVTARHHAQQQVQAMGLQIGSLIATVFLGEVGFYLQQYIDLLFQGVYQSFGRSKELQADEIGQEYAFKAGWDPRDTGQFLKTLNRIEHGRDRTVFHGFFASHPETVERIEKAEIRSRDMIQGREPGKRGRKEFLRLLNEMPYGNRPELGEFENNLYQNAESGVSIRFPDHWENFSSEGTVVSKRPDESYFMQLITAKPKDESSSESDHRSHDRGDGQRPTPKPKDDTSLESLTSREDYFIKLREMADRFESQSGWRRSSEEQMVIHDIPTFTANYQLQSSLGRFYSTTAHFMIIKKNLLILMAFAPVDKKDLADYYFKQVFDSVRFMSEPDIEKLQPRQVVIYEVRKHDTFETISEHFYGTTEKAREIAELNGYLSSLYPESGDLLKVIVRTKKEEHS